MGHTRKELIQFFERLTELVSEENQEEARSLIDMFMDGFEKDYQYGAAVRPQGGASCLPPYYIKSMPETMQQEIREKVTAQLKEHGVYSPEDFERAMDSKLTDLEDLLDVKEYVKRVEQEQQKAVGRNRGGRR